MISSFTSPGTHKLVDVSLINYLIFVHFKVSSSAYPTDSYALDLMNNSIVSSQFANETFTVEKVKNAVLAVNVYYKDLSYTQTSQQPKYRFIDLVSNIGGILGLYIGKFFERLFIFFSG